MLPREFFERDPVSCARDLIGMVYTWNDCSGIIVETEAYSEINDEAAHLHSRPNSRKFLADHAAGAAYLKPGVGVSLALKIAIDSLAVGAQHRIHLGREHR
ncbi:MAG: DNA-3-methyladenine glycosylase, partial [Verrucomicrobiota bacterium]